MSIGDKVLMEADPEAPIKGLGWLVRERLEPALDEVIDVLTNIDKTTGDWEKSGTLGKELKARIGKSKL